jgi:hypothetical protein
MIANMCNAVGSGTKKNNKKPIEMFVFHSRSYIRSGSKMRIRRSNQQRPGSLGDNGYFPRKKKKKEGNEKEGGVLLKKKKRKEEKQVGGGRK